MTTEETTTGEAIAADKPKFGKKASVAPQRAHVAPKKGKAGPKAKYQESAQTRQGGRNRPRRQQSGDGDRPTETARRRKDEGTGENHRLAAPFCSRLSVGRHPEEDGDDGDVHQGRRRGARLLHQALSLARIVPVAPPETFPAALLVLVSASHCPLRTLGF